MSTGGVLFAVKGLSNVLLFFILAFPSIFVGYYFMSSTFLTEDIVLTVFQTNTSEAQAYFLDHVSWLSSVLIIVLLFSLVLFIKWLNFSAFFTKSKPLCKCIVVVLTVLWCTFNGISASKASIYYGISHNVVDSLDSFKEYNAMRTERLRKLKNYNGQILKGLDGIFVLVIGESATRDHMQAYGYGRDNTPWLTKEKREKNVIVFEKAFSCHTHTVPALTYALTEKNQYNTVDLKNATSIMEVAKSAGYYTIWASNQEKYGAWDTPVASIASTADKEIWINSSVGRATKTNFYDAELLHRLKMIELPKKTFIVIHLMGSHGSYADRFPKKISKYVGSNNQIDDYDNSIYYTDSVLQDIYGYVSSLEDFQTMIYFSDHGEDVDKDNGHEASKFTPTMSHIPLVLLASNKYVIGKGKEMFANLQKHKEVCFTNDLIYNFQCGVMGIQDSDFALTSDKYDKNRKFKTLYGEKLINCN